jgi:hypothetical protein
MRDEWASEITRRAEDYWTPVREAQITRGKHLALTPRRAAPLLRALGLLNGDASMPPDRVRKFLQVNHMIAVLGPSLRELATAHERLRIVDAACGRSYLSLILAWHVRHNLGRDVEVVALDRNDEVVGEARRRAGVAGLTDLVRVEARSLGEVDAGEVRALFASPGEVHALVSLHACDTATDEALALGVALEATLLASAPCCQAELARAWTAAASVSGDDPSAFAPIHRVPHLRRELAAMLTDTLRALLLRARGWDCQPLEFVPSEHTPKNTLLRAMRRAPDPAARAEHDALARTIGAPPLRLDALLSRA